MKIVVCGAGIAGLTLAGQLQRHGHDLLVLERRREWPGRGYMIDFLGPGLDEAERLGLLPQLAQIHYPIGALVLVDAFGKRRVRLPYPDLRRRWFNDRHFNFMRGDLARILYDRLEPNVVKFGASVASVAEQATHVEIALTDGSHVTADLLVGADGFRSTVRRLVFGRDEQFVHRLGYRATAFVIDAPPVRLATEDFVTVTVPGKQVAVYPVRDGLATFFLCTDRESLSSSAGGCTDLSRRFGDLDWIVPEIVCACVRARDVYADDVAQVVMPEWYRGRVVLVGDACACVSLLAGQGASLALFAASVLADNLTALPFDTALAEYQRRIAPLVAVRQRAGRNMAKWFVPESRARLTVRDLLLRVSLHPLIAPLLRRQFAA